MKHEINYNGMRQFQNGNWEGQKNSQWAGHVSGWLYMYENGSPRLALTVSYKQIKRIQPQTVNPTKVCICSLSDG